MPHDTQDWAAVGDAIRKRRAKLGMSTARLARETGLSETTIRYIGSPGKRHNRSSLVAISAVLRWRYDHLTNILLRKPAGNNWASSPVAEMLSAIDSKLSVLMNRQAAGDPRITEEQSRL